MSETVNEWRWLWQEHSPVLLCDHHERRMWCSYAVALQTHSDSDTVRPRWIQEHILGLPARTYFLILPKAQEQDEHSLGLSNVCSTLNPKQLLLCEGRHNVSEVWDWHYWLTYYKLYYLYIILSCHLQQCSIIHYPLLQHFHKNVIDQKYIKLYSYVLWRKTAWNKLNYRGKTR